MPFLDNFDLLFPESFFIGDKNTKETHKKKRRFQHKYSFNMCDDNTHPFGEVTVVFQKSSVVYQLHEDRSEVDELERTKNLIVIIVPLIAASLVFLTLILTAVFICYVKKLLCFRDKGGDRFSVDRSSSTAGKCFPFCCFSMDAVASFLCCGGDDEYLNDSGEAGNGASPRIEQTEEAVIIYFPDENGEVDIHTHDSNAISGIQNPRMNSNLVEYFSTHASLPQINRLNDNSASVILLLGERDDRIREASISERISMVTIPNDRSNGVSGNNMSRVQLNPVVVGSLVFKAAEDGAAAAGTTGQSHVDGNSVEGMALVTPHDSPLLPEGADVKRESDDDNDSQSNSSACVVETNNNNNNPNNNMENNEESSDFNLPAILAPRRNAAATARSDNNINGTNVSTSSAQAKDFQTRKVKFIRIPSAEVYGSSHYSQNSLANEHSDATDPTLSKRKEESKTTPESNNGKEEER